MAWLASEHAPLLPLRWGLRSGPPACWKVPSSPVLVTSETVVWNASLSLEAQHLRARSADSTQKLCAVRVTQFIFVWCTL